MMADQELGFRSFFHSRLLAYVDPIFWHSGTRGGGGGVKEGREGGEEESFVVFGLLFFYYRDMGAPNVIVLLRMAVFIFAVTGGWRCGVNV